MDGTVSRKRKVRVTGLGRQKTEVEKRWGGLARNLVEARATTIFPDNLFTHRSKGNAGTSYTLVTSADYSDAHARTYNTGYYRIRFLPLVS